MATIGDEKLSLDEKVIETSRPSSLAKADEAHGHDVALPEDDKASQPSSLVGADETKEDEKESEDQFMSGTKLYFLVLGLGFAVLIMALDMSILVTAIPTLTAVFHATDDIGWYISGYMLTLCSLQPLSGKLYANFSLKWTFLSFFLIFEVGSAISGAATSSAMLIIGRAIAGSGAAGLMSGALSIIAVTVPLRLRGLYTGIIASLFSIAAIAGPLMGGAFTENVSWRWVFYINLPVGGVTIAALVFFFNPPERATEQDPVMERVKRLDIPGAFLFIPAVVMLLMALQWGGTTYAWNSSRIIGLFFGAGVILVVFLLWQWRAGDNGMLPSSIMLQRTVFWASWSAMFGMGAQMLLGVWMPEWFQAIKGASPTASGVRLLPSIIAQFIASILTGGMITQLGYYNPWLILGTILSGIGSGLFTTFKVDTPHPEWIGYMVIFGLGGGMFMTVPLISVQAVLDPAKTPIGISTITFFQMFGGALFSAVSQTIFNTQITKQLNQNVPGVDIAKLLAAGTVGVRKVVTSEQLPGVLKSYNVAILDPFYLGAAGCVVAFFCSFGLEWVSVKGKNLMAGEAA